MKRDEQRILNGQQPSEESINKVSIPPKEFADWWATYGKNFQQEGRSIPYFVRDNEKYLIKGAEAIKSKNASLVADVLTKVKKETSDPIKGRTEAQRANEKEVAGLLKVKQKQDMSFDDANKLRGNPNYQPKYIKDKENPNRITKIGKNYYKGIKKNPLYKKQYAVNCQSCVVANELRRRGLDVEAWGNTKRKGSIPTMLSYHTELAWVDKNGQTPTSQRTYGANVPATLTNLNTLTKEQGRYHIKWKWNSGRGGHIITCERLVDGTMRYYDPQNGKVITDFSFYASRFNLREGIEVLCVDTLQINPDIITGVVKAHK